MRVRCWLSDSLTRQFPRQEPGRGRRVSVRAARGERVSWQAAVRVDGPDPVEVSLEVQAPDDLQVRARRVGCVPVPHHNSGTPAEELDGVGHIPGYVPDPLHEDLDARLAPGETQAFWITAHVPADARPGPREVAVALRVGGREHTLTATVEVAPLVLQPRRGFPVTHWFYADALCDWYGVRPFSARFWGICEPYLRDCAEHGLDTILTPLFTPPTDGVKRPTQLLRVRRDGDRYRFDWRQVRRWIKLARSCGIRNFEWPHLFTQWGVKHAIRVYEGQGHDERLLWPPNTGACSPTYRNFLSQFLPRLHAFLKQERLLKRSYFHVSDEPHGDEHLESYRRAREMLRELAPWMRTMDALTDIRYGREKVTDMPIPSIRTTRQFHDEGIPSWTYFCCGPRGAYLNRLMDTPLPKMRMAGWLFYRFQRLGFLHWGYNYWYRRQTRQLIDPYTVSDGLAWPNWAYGDTFMVYPGEGGPVDSIRWEVFADSLQDYALLQSAGVDPEGELLAPLVDFDEFPKSARWIMSARDRILRNEA